MTAFTILGREMTERCPTWALDLLAIEQDGYGYECYKLTQDGVTVGWVYDDGAGYIWYEGTEDDAPSAVDR